MSDGNDHDAQLLVVQVSDEWPPQPVEKIPDIYLWEDPQPIHVFNLNQYFIDPDGEMISQLTPLLKSFGTWQKASVDIVAEDFRGSIWVISPHPIVSAAFIHQFEVDGSLSLLGNSKLELVASVHAEERLNPPE